MRTHVRSSTSDDSDAMLSSPSQTTSRSTSRSTFSPTQQQVDSHGETAQSESSSAVPSPIQQVNSIRETVDLASTDDSTADALQPDVHAYQKHQDFLNGLPSPCQ